MLVIGSPGPRRRPDHSILLLLINLLLRLLERDRLKRGWRGGALLLVLVRLEMWHLVYIYGTTLSLLVVVLFILELGLGVPGRIIFILRVVPR